MKKLKFILITCLIIFSACTNIVGDEPVVLDSTPPEETFEIDQPLLQKYLSLARKDNVLSQIKPIKESGKTLAYYVEYKEGGWELIAADKRFAPSLMKSSEGKIDEFAIFDGAIAQIKNCDINEPNAIWKVLSPLKPKEKPLSKRGITTGMWIGIDTIVETSTIDTDHILSTSWGTQTPWNQYMRYDLSYSNPLHCNVGCVAVATGQIIYHFRKNNNLSISVPTAATFSPVYGTPIFSVFTTNGWNYMETTANPMAPYTAIFLSYLNESYIFPISYGVTETTSLVDNAKRTFPEFRLQCDERFSYDYNLFYSQLMARLPLYVAISGHSVVVDRCVKQTTTLKANYYWDADHNVTEEEYFKYPQWMFSDMGNLGKDEMAVELASSNSVFFGVNWGWGGQGNDILYTAYSGPSYGFDENGNLMQSVEHYYSPSWFVFSVEYNAYRTYNNVTRVFYNFRNN